MPNSLDIMVPRNGHYQQDWQLLDNVGEPIDISDDALQLRVRAVAGQGSILASAAINPHDPTNGIFTVTLSGADFDSVSGESEIVRLAYDLVHIFSDGKRDIAVRGQIILMPGVS